MRANVIERFFNKINHFRGIATRYDKQARNYLAAGPAGRGHHPDLTSLTFWA
jgi:transposase